MRKLVLLVALLLVAAAIAIALVLPASYKGFPGESVTVEIARGKGASAIAADLAKAGVIRSPYFLLLARAFHPGAKLQAGEYEFSKPASPNEILDRLSRGDVVHYEVTIPEGSNIFDVANAVGKIPFLKSAKMLDLIRDPALIRDLDPKAPTLEGYLFPSTYRLARNTTEEQLRAMMVNEFRKVWKQQGGPAGSANVHDVVTLASLVEKESAAKDERPVVAAVYANRLEKGMRLECDPTTIYAAMLEGRYRGKIHRSDLDSENPFNTYRHIGLPPGPIANPGAGSIAAALHPAETQYIYFVAKPDGSGHHNFASDLKTHNRNVAEYRRGIAQQGN